MATYNPYEQFFYYDNTGRRRLKNEYSPQTSNVFATYFTNPGDATTFNYAKAGWADSKNPYEELKKIGYDKTQNPYSQEYINTLMDSIRKQAENTISSRGFANQSEDLRRQLANLGVLRGQAYDTTLQNRIADILSKAEEKAQQAGYETRLKGLEFESQEDRAAKEYARRLAEQASLFDVDEQRKKQQFLQDYMNKYLSGLQGSLETEDNLYNQIISKIMDYNVKQAETKTDPTYIAAIRAGFGGYADPITAYKTYIANPSAAARAGIMPNFKSSFYNSPEFAELGIKRSDLAEPTAKAAGFHGTVSGAYGLDGEPVRVIDKKVVKLSSSIPSIKFIPSTKLIVETADGRRYEIDEHQFMPY